MLLLLGAAVAVPFGASKLASLRGGSASKPAAATFDAALDSPVGARTLVGLSPTGQDPGSAYARIAGALRMDITPEWVYQRWQRKSTKLANLDRFGVRVPLVTGTQVDDLAGSLTYYFGAGNRVERISFHGRTGDPRALTHLVNHTYGLRPQPPLHPGEQLYQSKWHGRVKSEMRLILAPVLSSDTSHNAYEVSLELERPDSNYFLQDEREAAAQPPIGQAAPTQPPQNLETAAGAAAEKSRPPEPPVKKIQGPPLHRSLYFNPQRSVSKPKAK